jgi:hypothetical protein
LTNVRLFVNYSVNDEELDKKGIHHVLAVAILSAATAPQNRAMPLLQGQD